MDYIFEKDGIFYGCEVKNTLPYIDKNELEVKIKICNFLKIRPLFIMRFAPKSYIEVIRKEGGFAMIFETKIFELGQKELVDKIKRVIGLPVDCPREIPDGIIKRFENWHNKHK